MESLWRGNRPRYRDKKNVKCMLSYKYHIREILIGSMHCQRCGSIGCATEKQNK